jgi:hypothetical protein
MMNVGVGGPGQMMHPNPHDMGMIGVMNGGDMQNMQVAGIMQNAGPENDIMGMQNMAQDVFPQNVAVPGPGQMMGIGQEYGIQARSFRLYQMRNRSFNLILSLGSRYNEFISTKYGGRRHA